MDTDLYLIVEKALDTLAIEAALHAPNHAITGSTDWISVSLPKLRVNASPLVASALDAIESDPLHRDMFNKFVTDAITNPEFRESLKKSLRDPQTLILVKALIGDHTRKST